MAGLIAPSLAQSYSDHIAAAYALLAAQIGLKANAAAPLAYTAQQMAANLQAAVAGAGDALVEQDLVPNVVAAQTKFSVESFLGGVLSLVSQLNDHCSARGKIVSTAIVDFPSYLTYYNGGSGGAKFANVLTAEFQSVWQALFNSVQLPYPVCVAPMISLLQVGYLGITNAVGMGQKTVAGVFTAGSTVNFSLYGELQPTLVVTTTFTGGSAPPTFTITGLDDTGSSNTWTATGVGNNPAAALSGTGNIVGAVNAGARQTVVVTSTTGIVPGSVLTIDSGLPDQEVVLVEAVPDGTHLTAVFKVAHNAGATVTGNTTYTTTPPSGKRIRSVTAIAMALTGHSAGTVRVDGFPDRLAI